LIIITYVDYVNYPRMGKVETTINNKKIYI